MAQTAPSGEHGFQFSCGTGGVAALAEAASASSTVPHNEATNLVFSPSLRPFLGRL
jgi:hypothetical protein